MQAIQKNNKYASIRNKLWSRCLQPSQVDWDFVCRVNQLADDLRRLSDQGLAEKTIELRTQARSGELLTNGTMLLQVAALTRQALKRTTGLDAYDVQVLAGMAMSHGAITEMQTGEGKTLTSAFPIAVHALTGRGVHVATVNAYLAERDCNFLKPALEMMGFTVGISNDGASSAAKRLAYHCDITFATGYELGFDYLRDQIALMSHGPQQLGAKLRRALFSDFNPVPVEAQRGHCMAIIDEIDSVLIDEAITPLVLSSGGLAKKIETSIYTAARLVAEALENETDFLLDPKTNSLALTQQGFEKAHQVKDRFMSQNYASSPCGAEPESNPFDRLANSAAASPRDQENFQLLRPWKQYVESALRAQHVMVRDVNYVVRENKIEIVDEYTGRIFSDRNWRDGLHQAVEAKEGLPITQEKRTIARVSRQRYFQRYEMLCGMTGTANGHQREMQTCYKLPIIIIPLRNKSRRCELPCIYFDREQTKTNAIVSDTRRRHASGQPVLIGTRTIEQSRQLCGEFDRAGIRHSVLNGVQDQDEANLITTAGRAGSVTVATNMAGRGTDIKLDADALASGGLHVIGFERNSSARIDRQLLGRAGRQGEPGSGQFYVSADDELITRFDMSLAQTLRHLPAHLIGQPNSGFDHQIARIQAIAERESYQARTAVMQEELWLDQVKQAVG